MSNAMKYSNNLRVLIPLLILGIACIPRGCSAVLVTDTVTDVEPNWYKITIASQDITVDEYNSTAGTIIGVALTLGIAQNFGDTSYVAAAVINSTQNATISYKHVDQGSLYLVIFFIEYGNKTVEYQINCTHQMIEYSYSAYYNDVTLPEIIPKVVLLAVALGGLGLIVTVVVIKRQRRERKTI
jgi:hypothetical protein